LIQGWQIPEDWRQRVLANLNRNEARANAEQKAQRLRRRLARLKVLFLEADLEEREYRQQKAATEKELALCTAPSQEEVDVMAAAELLTDFNRLWQEATPSERKSLLRSMVERVEVRGKEVVAVRPRPLFAWLLNNLS
jgi:acyl-CoA reductase-like NAD-dependent aldehyde dehydrogenase